LRASAAPPLNPPPAPQAISAMMQHIGGKLMVFHSVQPSLGRSQGRKQEDLKALGTDRETQLLSPASEFFKQHGLEVCSKNQISIDLFSCCDHYADLATLSPLSKFTNGQLYHYPGFDRARDGDSLRADLSRALTRQARPNGFTSALSVTLRTSQSTLQSTPPPPCGSLHPACTLRLLTRAAGGGKPPRGVSD
jgi:hypothetical protein